VKLKLRPFENDRVLGNLDEHFGGNFLHEETLLSYAAGHGYNTAAIGKLGPTLIQDGAEAKPVNGLVPVPRTVIIDDSTEKAGGIPLDPESRKRLPTSIFQSRTRPSNGAATTSKEQRLPEIILRRPVVANTAQQVIS
jgi:hypothetical protein